MLPRILLVDDHGLVRTAIGGLLAGICDICGEADNGLEAVEKVTALKPDIVLLDLSMPVMGGATAAQEIRKIAPAVKIIFLSMHDSDTIVQLTRLAGGDACLSKRSPVAELRKAITAVLDVPAQEPNTQATIHAKVG